MNNTELSYQEDIGNPFVEDIKQLNCSAPGEEAGKCHVCDEEFEDGESIVFFASRPRDNPEVVINHAKCADCREHPTEFFTLGMRDLVLEARIGRCVDVATQSSWRVLLDLELIVVSDFNTRTVTENFTDAGFWRWRPDDCGQFDVPEECLGAAGDPLPWTIPAGARPSGSTDTSPTDTDAGTETPDDGANGDETEETPNQLTFGDLEQSIPAEGAD